jgi:hypothetical protein
MYCQGLGDCFLLSFPRKSGARPVRVLIDCGVLQRTPAESEKMRAVVRSLKKDPGGHIDLLIVTHEHWDHIAGFSHGQDLFEKQFTFDRVWLSWAENPKDPDSQALKAELGKKRAKLAAALGAARLRVAARSGDPHSARLLDDLTAIEGVQAFFGAAPAPAAAAPKMSLGDTMDWLRAKVRPGDFRTPGERLPITGTDGIHAYVLGPPKDTAKIRKMNPTGDQGYRHLADRLSLLGALDWLTEGGDREPAAPFDDRYRVPVADAVNDPFFREYYGFPDDPLGDSGAPWRRIDDEWLVGGLGRLALQLDTGVNNTSLALAFELSDGRTMFFPGDAQIGNWLSWDEVKFKDEAGKPLTVTTADLLARAVFYKVGHHGSHNATRKKGGLESMTSGDVVAMIPTDEKFGLAQKPNPWQMPFAELNEALRATTYHRILRADRGKADMQKEAAEGRNASAARWKEFAGRVKFPAEKMIGDNGKKGSRPLYVEYALPL